MTAELERQAANGEPLPDGLTLEDQLLFLSLRNLYKAYRNGFIGKENATAEKGKLMYEHERRQRIENMNRRCAKHTTDMWASIGAQARDYAKNRSLETADKLLRAIDGRLTAYENGGNP